MEKYIEEYNRWKRHFEGDELKELASYNESEIHDAFYQSLSFGTAGMRGKMGLGTNRLNAYTLRRANYGYGKYLKDKYDSNISVVIARDNRRNGEEFVKECVKVLSTFNIKCYIFSSITPTPVLSFGVRYLHANGGIVVTASHNNKDYNGYKIYDNEGCQLVPRLASIVTGNVNNAPDYFDIKVNTFEDAVKKGLVEYVPASLEDAYVNEILKMPLKKDLNKDNFKICYTPLHGTGGHLASIILDKLGYNYIKVKEQFVNDPNFTTVPYPNPEDPNAFNKALEYAKKDACDIIIATDPDADRIGVAVRLEDGSYKLLTGNETGALLIYYICTNSKITKESYMIDTIVTSRLGRTIATYYGVNTIQTFTGFKFIGEQITKLVNEHKNYMFGYEEAFGYTLNTIGRDKDSLQGITMVSEMACFYKSKGLTLVDVLDLIHQKFGYIESIQNTLVLDGEEGSKQIKAVMAYLRENTINTFGKFNVISEIDYNKEDYIVNGINLGKSDVIEYNLGNNMFVIFRPSGTEPKLKCYIGSNGISEDESKDNARIIKDAVNEIYDKILK